MYILGLEADAAMLGCLGTEKLKDNDMSDVQFIDPNAEGSSIRNGQQEHTDGDDDL